MNRETLTNASRLPPTERPLLSPLRLGRATANKAKEKGAASHLLVRREINRRKMDRETHGML